MWGRRLKGSSWRIDVKTKARHIEQLNEPTAIMELQLGSEESEKVSVVLHKIVRLFNVLSSTCIVCMCSYGGQSQECPGMVWLHGNPGILGQGGSLETLLYTVHVHGGQSQECPGKVWLVTWESRDTWTGGSLATLYMQVFLWWTITGVSWDGLVTWESRDTWTGG